MVSDLFNLKLLSVKQLSFIAIAVFTMMIFINYGCKKTKVDTCTYDGCDSGRKTVVIADNSGGYMSINSTTGKWAVNSRILGTIDGTRTSIICIDINDSLKVIGKSVIFSGEIKEGCDYPKSDVPFADIYYITPTKIQ